MPLISCRPYLIKRTLKHNVNLFLYLFLILHFPNLHHMGFGNKWIGWTESCISFVRFSVIINGSVEGFFPTFEGLRQGVTLSPFLCILVMDDLSSMLPVEVCDYFIYKLKLLERVNFY